MRGQYRKDYRQANRGRALEQLIEIANRQYRAQGIAFVLVEFTATHQHLVVPWSRWRAGWERSKHNGPASVSLAELEKVPEYIVKGTMRAALDYLEAVDRLWPELLRTERVG